MRGWERIQGSCFVSLLGKSRDSLAVFWEYFANMFLSIDLWRQWMDRWGISTPFTFLEQTPSPSALTTCMGDIVNRGRRSCPRLLIFSFLTHRPTGWAEWNWQDGLAHSIVYRTKHQKTWIWVLAMSISCCVFLSKLFKPHRASIFLACRKERW